MPITCPHCGNWNYFPRGSICGKCGKDMMKSLDEQEQVAGEEKMAMRESPNRATDLSRIADAVERNATATERIFWLAVAVLSFGLIAVAVIAVVYWS